MDRFSFSRQTEYQVDTHLAWRNRGTNVSWSRDQLIESEIMVNSCPKDPRTSYVKRVIAIEGDFIWQVVMHFHITDKHSVFWLITAQEIGGATMWCQRVTAG